MSLNLSGLGHHLLFLFYHLLLINIFYLFGCARIFIAACRVFSCGMQTLNLWHEGSINSSPSAIEPGPLALGSSEVLATGPPRGGPMGHYLGDENLGGHELLQGNKQKTWGLKARGTGQLSLQPFLLVLRSCPSPPEVLSPLPWKGRSCNKCVIHRAYNPHDHNPYSHHSYSLPLIALILYQMEALSWRWWRRPIVFHLQRVKLRLRVCTFLQRHFSYYVGRMGT